MELTPPEGRGGDVLARALASISELCTSIDFSLEEGESRYKVGLLHSEFGEMLGPPMAHRRFVYEGELAELVVERGRTTATRRNVILFNDGMLLTTGAHTARDALECISLAKVRADGHLSSRDLACDHLRSYYGCSCDHVLRAWQVEDTQNPASVIT